MNKWIEILFGLVLIVGTILVGYYWGAMGILVAAVEFLKGGVFWFLIFIGFLFTQPFASVFLLSVYEEKLKKFPEKT